MNISKAYDQLLARTDVDFFRLPEMDHWNVCADLGAKWGSKFSDIVVVGIGGSSLGLAAIFQTLGKKEKQLHLLDNVDPEQWRRFKKDLKNWAQAGFIFISKSGSTLETLSVAQLILQELQIQKLSISNHCAVIVEAGANPLREWGEKNQCVCVDVPKKVGGRFSVLSAVGMFPAAALGYNIENFRKGSAAALKNRAHIEKLSQQFLESFKREEWITFFWFYSSYLREFGFWLGQLWSESLAKAKDRKGHQAPRVSSSYPGVGACDQHSVLQQLMEGARDKYICFFVEKNQNQNGETFSQMQFANLKYLEGKRMGQIISAEALATEQALRENGASTMFLEIDPLNEQTLGELFMTFQLVVGAMGEALDINAFDQPGVEQGKILAKGMLSK